RRITFAFSLTFGETANQWFEEVYNSRAMNERREGPTAGLPSRLRIFNTRLSKRNDGDSYCEAYFISRHLRQRIEFTPYKMRQLCRQPGQENHFCDDHQTLLRYGRKPRIDF